jgi:restriction system protein
MKDKPVILVVDDQPQNIELLAARLAPQGYKIIRAADGEEALEKISGNQIDLILLDVMMPGIDGFEVIRRIRQDETHRQLPIILVTALRETKERVKGIEAGCDDFLSKPVDKIELLARVRSLLKVKAYNDLMSNYRKELESDVATRTKVIQMAEKDFENVNMWGIHSGRAGEADSIFLKENQLALGWMEMIALTNIAPDLDAFKKKIKEKIMEAAPKHKLGFYPMAAGLFLFVHEMKEGDLIIYPSKIDKRIHIGKVTGAYQYFEKEADNYPHRRAVEWLQDFPRTKFSQGALYETGPAMTFFQIKNYADEFLAALSGEKPTIPPDEDVTVSYVAEDVEQNTRDFILKIFSQKLNGHTLAVFVAHLLEKMGYLTRAPGPGQNGAVDIIAHKDELGFVLPIIKVQVKSTEDSIGDLIVSQLIGKLDQEESGMIVTLGKFTNQAKSTAHKESRLRLIDGEDLVNLLLQHYEQLDSKYKDMIPLKRVYVPEPMEEQENQEDETWNTGRLKN